MSLSARQPAGYELRVEGRLDTHWSAWFGGLDVIPQSDGTTKICGLVDDQAALHGLLTKIRDLGLTLISVISVEPITASGGVGTGPDRTRPRPDQARQGSGLSGNVRPCHSPQSEDNEVQG